MIAVNKVPLLCTNRKKQSLLPKMLISYIYKMPQQALELILLILLMKVKKHSTY